MVINHSRIGLAAIGAMAISAFAVSDAGSHRDLDLMFVIDKSGSMATNSPTSPTMSRISSIPVANH